MTYRTAPGAALANAVRSYERNRARVAGTPEWDAEVRELEENPVIVEMLDDLPPHVADDLYADDFDTTSYDFAIRAHRRFVAITGREPRHIGTVAEAMCFTLVRARQHRDQPNFD